VPEETENGIRRVYRVRVVLFLLCIVLGVLLLSTISQGIQTLARLDVVERERDQWQRPSDVLQVMGLRSGNTAVDLGCGSGYFALKLSPIVGTRGKVFAVDIRRLPLLFVWSRAFFRGEHNISIIHAQPDDPRLPLGIADAVLIANTYHELTYPNLILRRVFDSLRPGGRLVVLDRAPQSRRGEPRGIGTKHHEMPLDMAENEIFRSGFEIIRQQDHFIDRRADETWWLIIARKL
jgi:predicted methyltransferase